MSKVTDFFKSVSGLFILVSSGQLPVLISGTLQNSNIYSDGTSIGIGNNNPQADLRICGTQVLGDTRFKVGQDSNSNSSELTDTGYQIATWHDGKIYIDHKVPGDLITWRGGTSTYAGSYLNLLTLIPSTGEFNIKLGNIKFGTSGKGVDFSADSNAAGMTSELLDDYEEGTWTVGITFGGGNTGVTYNAGAGPGKYTKVGRKVTASVYFLLTSKGSSTGQAVLTGLPFAMGSGWGDCGTASLSYMSGLTFAGIPQACVYPATTTLYLLQSASGGAGSYLTNADFTNTTAIMLTVTYFTA
jgi:hypothetical protein